MSTGPNSDDLPIDFPENFRIFQGVLWGWTEGRRRRLKQTGDMTWDSKNQKNLLLLQDFEPFGSWIWLKEWLITHSADSEGFRMTERFRRWRVQGKMVSSYRWNQRSPDFPHVWPLPKGHLPVFYGLDSLDGPFLDDLPMKNIGVFHGNQLLGGNLEDPLVRIHLDELDFLQLFLSDLQTAWKIPWGVRPPLPATQGEFNGKIYPLVNCHITMENHHF
jgi:hypothetical protein